MRLAARMDRIGTETAFEAAARARALEATGRSIIHLEIGEPDFDTPSNIRQAAKQALDRGATHYTPTVGIPELRAAIAADATARKCFTVSPDRVIVVPGAKPVMFFSMLALIQEGDEVIYPDPGFPIYESMVDYVGGTAVPCPIRQENAFRLDPRELASLVTKRTRLIIINSPANPTGGVSTRDDLEQIAAVAREHDLLVLADEIYGRILYEGEFVSIASLPGMAERTITCFTFSKTYAMTGLRAGYNVAKEPFMEAFRKVVLYSTNGIVTPVQYGMIAGLRMPESELIALREAYRMRRDLLVAGLNEVGLTCAPPAGAFYAFPNVEKIHKSSLEASRILLEEAHISTIPGIFSGPEGEGHLRFCYATEPEKIEACVEALRAFFAKR